MSDRLALTSAFLEHQPKAAAEVVGELDPADAAALLDAVPARLAGPVVGEMASWTAARLVAELSAEQAAEILRAMIYQDAVSLLRMLDPARVETLLAGLPRRLAREFGRSLEYPLNVVGAWMDQSLPGFATDDTVADGMKFLRRRDARALSHLFVVDRERRFSGTVAVGRLLHAPAQSPLGDLLEDAVRPLSNRDLLTSVAGHERWDEHLVLPVVGRRNNVLGGLSRQALRQGLQAQRRSPARPRSNAIVMQMFVGYAVACAGLLRLALPPARAVGETGRPR